MGILLTISHQLRKHSNQFPIFAEVHQQLSISEVLTDCSQTFVFQYGNGTNHNTKFRTKNY